MSACRPEWSEAVSAWFDGEVEATERARLEAHLAQCAGCAALAGDFAALREGLRVLAAPQALELPPRLKAAVAQLDSEACADGPPGAALGEAASAPRARRPRWALPGARRLSAAAAALLLGSGLLWTGWPRGFNEALAADLERHHLRAFSRAKPCEFESSDPAAVRAWALAQTGEAVEVPNVPGARLLGARRCRLDGRITISLLYRYGNHALTLFAPSADSSAGEQGLAFAQQGPRCTQGPVGERICVAARGDDVTIAVSELGDPVLLGALAASGQP